MDERGYLVLRHVAEILSVSYTTAYRYYIGFLKNHRLEGIRVGRQIYIRKTSLAKLLKDFDPDNALTLAWLMGLEPTGECHTCALPIPLKQKRCPLCTPLEIGNKL